MISTSLWPRRLTLAVVITSAAMPALAGLGEPVARLQQDRAALGAGNVTVTKLAGYERHAMVMPGGTQVHAFAGRDGTVFAVTFEGRALPDLSVLLGTRFSEYVAQAHPSPSTHKIYTHHSGTLELTIIKLPRGFAGNAFVPGAVPAGIDPRDLH